jgi:hypothetical protein
MDADIDDDTLARIVWRCPFGCGLEYPLCHTCFPHVHHQPQDQELIRWDALHLHDGCWSATHLYDGSEEDGGATHAALQTNKDLRRYTALLAAEVWPQDAQEPGYDLHCWIRVAARGQFVQAVEWRHALTKIAEPGRQSAFSCAVSAAAVHVLTQVKIHGRRHTNQASRYATAVEAAATASGVSDARRAQLVATVLTDRWSRGERVSQDVRDAAAAAISIGRREFAQNLVEMWVNDQRKRRSTGA